MRWIEIRIGQGLRSGGNAYWDPALGVYVIQESFMAAGDSPAVAVTARELPKERPDFFVDVEESIEWTLEFANGAKARGYSSYNSSRNDFRAEAANGWYEVTNAYSYRGQKAATSKGPVNATPPASQQALQIDGFAQDVLEGVPYRGPGEMGRRDMVVVEGIYASAAAGGKRVELKF